MSTERLLVVRVQSPSHLVPLLSGLEGGKVEVEEASAVRGDVEAVLDVVAASERVESDQAPVAYHLCSLSSLKRKRKSSHSSGSKVLFVLKSAHGGRTRTSAVVAVAPTVLLCEDPLLVFGTTEASETSVSSGRGVDLCERWIDRYGLVRALTGGGV